MADVQRIYAESPLPLFLLTPTDRWSTNYQSEQLRNLVRRSGGYALQVLGQQAAAVGATEMAESIRAPYMLFFPAPPLADERALRGLHLAVKGVQPKPKLYYGSAFEVRRHGQAK